MARSTDGAKRPKSHHNRHGEALAELQRYRLLVESVQDYAIFLMDPQGYVQTWNKGAEKIKGYKPHEIIGKHFSSFYLLRDKESKKPERELDLVMRFGRIEDEDWRVRKDGSKFWANVIITALYDDTNMLVGFAKVTRDLTERKQHEDEVRRTNLTLQQQQIELERMNTSKDEFISLASHQLRTPATGIKQYLGMLLEGFLGDLTPEQLHAVQSAYDSNERQLMTVNSLLKVAQLDAGKITLQKQKTDVDAMLRSIMQDNAEKFSNRMQEATLETDTFLEADIDRSYYRMAVENLVDNASKYTPNGGCIVVTGRLEPSRLIVSVQDNGVGIAAEDIPKLFTKFSRLPNSLSDNVDGSGLGLYWANKIIRLHGGKIDVKPAIHDKGTLFSIEVPRE